MYDIMYTWNSTWKLSSSTAKFYQSANPTDLIEHDIWVPYLNNMSIKNLKHSSWFIKSGNVFSLKNLHLCSSFRKRFRTFWTTLVYLYIYCHLQADCFIVSQLFSVARHIGHFKPGSKPAQLYVRLSIIPLSQQADHISSGIIRYYVVAFICLHFALLDTRVLNSSEELCIMRVAAINSFARVLNSCGGAYILSSIDRLFHCITTLQCG